MARFAATGEIAAAMAAAAQWAASTEEASAMVAKAVLAAEAGRTRGDAVAIVSVPAPLAAL